MAKIKASQLLAQLKKSQSIGFYYEPVTVNSTQLVLRNLTPSEYTESMAQAEPFEEVDYIHHLQIAQLSRGICEIDGVNLDLYQHVIVDDADGKEVTIDRSDWMGETHIGTWSRELVGLLWQKLMEVIKKADSDLSKQIHFDLTQETPEDKVRRQLAEVSESSKGLPDDLLTKIYADHGLMSVTATTELDRIAERSSGWVATEEPLDTSVDNAPPAPPEPVAQVSEGPSPLERAKAQMAARQPLNQSAPALSTTSVDRSREREVPEVAVPRSQLSRRAQELAALESNAADSAVPILAPTLNAEEFLVDQPVAVGVNPKFQPRR